MRSVPSISPRGKRKRVAAGLILILGSLLCGAGAWLLFSRAQSREVTRVAGLERVEPGRFRQLPVGAEVLLEGRLVAREPLGPEGFVAYTEQYFLRRETEGADRGREEWGERSVPRPLIAVEQGGQVVELCNRDYSLLRLPHDWQSDTTLRSGDLLHEGTLRRRGFKVSDALTVDGRVQASDAKSCILAKAVSGGDALAYVAEQREGVVALRVVGAVFAGLGAILLAIGALLRRAKKPLGESPSSG
jgi:hypothetical protein